MDRFEEWRQKILPVLMPYGVKQVAVFGSMVRGEDTPDSDAGVSYDQFLQAVPA